MKLSSSIRSSALDRRICTRLAGILILAHVLLLTWAALNNAVTVDEYAHLPAGAVYWKYHEFWLYDLSPPLLRMWAAAPAVLCGGVDVPPARQLLDQSPRSRHWNYAQSFMDANRPRYQRLFIVGRLAMIPISCFGAWVLYRWASALYGLRGALLPCALYCLDPNFIAHGSLVTTDVGTAVMIVTSAWLWWRFGRRPNPSRLLLASVALAVAILCKFSAILLVPAVVLVAVAFVTLRNRNWRTMLAGLLVAGVVCLLLINLAYGYHRSFQPLRRFGFESQRMRWAANHLPGWLRVPLPEALVEGMDEQMLESPNEPAFALGHSYIGSRWYYFPLALLCKLPLAALVVLAATSVSFTFKRSGFHELVPLIVMAVVGLGIALFLDMNIGVRHILPAVPLLYLFSGRLFTRRWFPTFVMIAMLAAEVFPAGPNYISFFNTAAGGPSRAQFILNDSNFDWGQGLVALRRWMDQNHVDRIGLAYFGKVDPAIYGIKYEPLTQPIDADLVAVSSYFLVGMPQRVRVDADRFSDFVRLRDAPGWQKIAPLAVVDRVIYVYRRSDVQALFDHGAALEPYAP